MATAAGMAQQPFNINQAAAQGIQAAGLGTAANLGFRPQQISAGTFQPTTIGAPSQVSATGYQAAQTGQVAPLQAQQVQAGQLASTGLSPYMNPYESQVVGQTLSDLERARQMQQNVLGAQAGAAGAYGGSRMGVAEAETNRAFAEQAARTAGQLRQAGFTQAQQAAQQDIASRMQADLANQQAGLQAGMTSAQLQQQANLANQQAQQQAREFGATQGMNAQQLNQAAQMQQALANQQAMQQGGMFNVTQGLEAQRLNQLAGIYGARERLGAAGQLADIANLGFGMGRQANMDLAQQGMMQQALQQQLMDAARQQYAGFQQSPQQALQNQIAGLQASDLGTRTTTEQRNLGLMDYLQFGAAMVNPQASMFSGLFGGSPRMTYSAPLSAQYGGQRTGVQGLNYFDPIVRRMQ